jgi:hypothetical protein
MAKTTGSTGHHATGSNASADAAPRNAAMRINSIAAMASG